MVDLKTTDDDDDDDDDDKDDDLSSPPPSNDKDNESFPREMTRRKHLTLISEVSRSLSIYIERESRAARRSLGEAMYL
jgi:hypothetical protein